jgi:hypothetical protein
VLLARLTIATVFLAGCAAHESSRPVDAEAAALRRATVETLEREACGRLLTQTFPIEDAGATTGKLWVRKCTTHAVGEAIDVDVDVVGWQWAGQGSWGFVVQEYVYFVASVHTHARASIEVDGDHPALRVWSDEPPDVTVRELGRVSARASSPAASLLGVASGVFGRGPNALATSALRSHVADDIREHAKHGVLVALGRAPAPGARAAAAETLLDETQVLHPGGALISGSYPEGSVTRLRFDVAGSAAPLARAVCVDEAIPLVDAVVSGAQRPTTGSPDGVVVLRGSGDVEMPARSCRWVLVTGVQGDEAATVHVTLSPATIALHAATRRWVRATVRAYEIDGLAKELVALRVGREGKMRGVGRPLTSARATALWIVADPVELADADALVVDIVALTPRSRQWWSDKETFDERLLGRAQTKLSQGAAHDDRRVEVQRDGRTVGWVELGLDALEVQ